MTTDLTQSRIALQDVMLTYAAAVDERDQPRYLACFEEDVEVVGFGNKTYRNRDQWVDYVWRALDKYSATQHMLGPTLATISGNRACTRTDVQALHFIAGKDTHFVLWATYKTDMQRRGDNWKISRHELIVTGTSSY
ncbi:nuclear transport factor 2 family protein [Candidatus Marimicrobium litorale]|uniref:Nuclear transport factor 2 family protein n=1 Tax=Candidatus Marimicrobium litorale TaxID=2518991 RepID=A0ABT3T5K2_9GAMM|nr:nuclear transport factor 2 family protein [Candidatus Marimicrobium litorale]MCX2976757.1 nuclear transport factor 2 family protein [Candidatus Marimicrobium litorale]